MSGTFDGFPQMCDVVLGVEKGSSMVRSDPGNWTGGRVGSGKLKGTKFGIAAATFPTLDIQSLTEADAIGIFFRTYAQPACVDQMPYLVGLSVFDAAINSGVSQAAKWLQQSLNATADGRIGGVTLAALKSTVDSGNTDTLLIEMHARRLLAMTTMRDWPNAKGGWVRRVVGLAYQPNYTPSAAAAA